MRDPKVIPIDIKGMRVDLNCFGAIYLKYTEEIGI